MRKQYNWGDVLYTFIGLLLLGVPFFPYLIIGKAMEGVVKSIDKDKESIAHIYNIIILAIFVIFTIIFIRLFYLRENSENKKLDDIDDLKQDKEKLLIKIDDLKKDKEKLEDTILLLRSTIKQKDLLYHDYKTVFHEKYRGFSEMYSDILTIQDQLSAEILWNKKRPALIEAKRIQEVRAEKRLLIEENKILLYKYELLLTIFPELSEYIDDFETLKELCEFKNINEFKDEYDRVKDYISKEDYLKLSEVQRNQMALDRYKNSHKKDNRKIGRDYEMYCGYVFRKEGFNVVQFGVLKGLKDMGRDIIAQKGECTYIVQCKYWSQSKMIHEKHIAQIYGSTIEYSLSSDLYSKIYPMFITNIGLSNTAGLFAQRLGVTVKKWDMGDYPMIKCNINNGNKIYHLPFDQQYDSSKIEKLGEFYAWTVEEAVKAGFRRAFRHRIAN